jgi:TP53 regulating kinase-like protein
MAEAKQMQREKIIGRGAEALLIEKDGTLIKRRIKKGYRHPTIDDNLRIARTRRESKILCKASAEINVPRVFNSQGNEIVMEFIDGKVLSQDLDDFPMKKALEICKKIGESTAKIHDINIIHGDLTTSNMIFKDNKVYFIDFGLGFHSMKPEDKAVDLYLLREALKSKHFRHYDDYYEQVLEGYKKSRNYAQVIERLKKVECRGRYKRKHQKKLK